MGCGSVGTRASVTDPLIIPNFAAEEFIRAPGGLLDMIAHLLLRLSSILHVFL
jgi:hypothetical protein